MTKKLLVVVLCLLLLSLLLLLMFIVTPAADKESSHNNNEQQTEQISESKIKVFIDNSYSMAGYYDYGEEKDKELNLFTSIDDLMIWVNKTYDGVSREIYSIAGKSTAPLTSDYEKSHMKKIFKDNTNFSIPNPSPCPKNSDDPRCTSKLNDIVETILNETDENSISFLVTDLIYSIPKESRDKDNKFNMLQNGTMQVFLEKNRHDKNFAVVLIRLMVKFSGKYYHSDETRTTYHNIIERPVYILAVGNEEKLLELLGEKEKLAEKINNFKEIAYLMKSSRFTVLPAVEGDNAASLKLINPGRIGEGGAIQRIYRYGEVEKFSVLTNISCLNRNSIKPEDFNEDFSVESVEPFSLDKLSETNKKFVKKLRDFNPNKDFTHIINLKKKNDSNLKINIKEKLPDWVENFSTDDDINNYKDETTFGLKYFVNGVKNAFQDSDDSCFSINLAVGGDNKTGSSEKEAAKTFPEILLTIGFSDNPDDIDISSFHYFPTLFGRISSAFPWFLAVLLVIPVIFNLIYYNITEGWNRRLNKIMKFAGITAVNMLFCYFMNLILAVRLCGINSNMDYPYFNWLAEYLFTVPLLFSAIWFVVLSVLFNHWYKIYGAGRLEIANFALKYVNEEFEKAGADEEKRRAALGIIKPNDYHKIISDCLDVGMMFYYKKRLGDKCEIIEVGTNFEERYQNEQNIGCKRFLNALSTFEASDGIFGNMNFIEIVKWGDVVVGGTSPISLFVAADGVRERLSRADNLPDFLFKDKPFCERPSGFRHFIQKRLPKEGMSEFKKYIANCMDYYRNKTITADDLFEKYIVKAYRPIDKNKFRCFNGAEAENYFLPLKEEFFERFGLDAVENVEFERERDARFNVGSGERITVNYGTYKKVYQYGEEDNKYEIKMENAKDKTGFGLSLSFFPFIEPNENCKSTLALHTENIDAECKMLLCQEGSVSDVDSDFQYFHEYSEASHLKSRHSDVSEKYNLINLKITKENDSFSVFIVPILQKLPQTGDVRYNFSVDIGTTNTYITYNTNQNPTPRPFEVFKDNEELFVKLYKYDSQEQNTRDFIGTDIGKLSALEFLPPNKLQEGEVKFPLRTVVWKDSERNPKGFDFIYESIWAHQFNLEFEKEFKWNAGSAQKCFKVSIEQLANLIGNFVALRGGILNSLTTFYPISMENGLKESIKTAWENWCKGKEVNFRWVSESEAPMEMERINHERLGDRTCFSHYGITTDIGGGSTDVAFYNEDGEVVATTSFEFAVGEDFFAYLNPRKVSERITRVENSFKHIFGETYYDTLFGNFLDNGNFSDANSFLLSKTTDYSEDLKNNKRVNLIIYYFYAAILYHIAVVYRRYAFNEGQQVVLPFVIVFSGNGSKILQQIRYENFTNDFMKKCIQVPNGCIRTEFEPNPKTVTAEGGLYIRNTDPTHEKVLLPGGHETPNFEEARTEDFREQCLNEFVDFSNIFFEIAKEYTEERYLQDLKEKVESAARGVNGSNVREIKDYYVEFLGKMEDMVIGENVENEQKRTERLRDKLLSQTTFFFPIKGVIRKALNALKVDEKADPKTKTERENE